MKKGFTFKNKHSDYYGITMQSKSRPILPEMKTYTYDAPLYDGVYDFSQANAANRAFFQNRTITVIMQITASDLAAMEEKVSQIAVWLTGRGVLIFDDMPLVKWRACVRNMIDFVPERSGTKAVLSVTFDTEPFSECVFDTETGIELDTPIELDTEIPLNISYGYTYENVNDMIGFFNVGTWTARPVFKFTGTNGGLTKIGIYTTSGKGIVYECYTPKSPIMFDFENQTVKDAAGNNLSAHTQGDFPEFKPGLTYISLSCADDSGECDTALEIIYAPKYIYNFEWGQCDD